MDERMSKASDKEQPDARYFQGRLRYHDGSNDFFEVKRLIVDDEALRFDAGTTWGSAPVIVASVNGSVARRQGQIYSTGPIFYSDPQGKLTGRRCTVELAIGHREGDTIQVEGSWIEGDGSAFSGELTRGVRGD